MCGICGVAALEGRLNPEIGAALPSMTEAIRHRGPDGGGVFRDSIAGLGHRRLAIIDREGGVQPMPNEDKSCWIVFNGEVYNHAALRAELLARGHRFRTVSDTEAILHAYEEFGPACVDRLEGMFAFAIYDQTRRTVFLARDRIGKKPLFYATFGGALHFGSEIKALRESPAWDGDIDLSELESYLSLGYFIAPKTVYRHVRKLEPGHWLRLRDGKIEIRQYWDVTQFDDDGRDETSLVEDLQNRLATSVRERLESEVPLGAFLSGGIDSGLVVSYMAEAVREPVITASVGFGEAAHNELGPAGLTATRYHTAHHSQIVAPKLDDVLDRIVEAFDEPFADSSAVPTYYVSQEARRHVTVALTGDGGDETFGGYGFRYVPHAIESRVRAAISGFGGQSASGWAGAHWPRSARLPKPLRLGTFLDNIGRDADAAYYADLCFLKPDVVHKLLGLPNTRDPRESAVFDAVTAPYRRCPSPSPIQKAQYADLKVYLPNDVLVKVDRMSMQHALEVRCPLLDRRLVEFAFRIPTASKMPRLKAKHLLRRVAEPRLPAELLQLKKRGFTAPVGEWIAGPYAERFRSEVLDNRSVVASLIDMRQVRRMFIEQQQGRANHSYALWALWMLERWSHLTSNRPQLQGVAGVFP